MLPRRSAAGYARPHPRPAPIGPAFRGPPMRISPTLALFVVAAAPAQPVPQPPPFPPTGPRGSGRSSAPGPPEGPAAPRNGGGPEGPIQGPDDGKLAAIGHMYQNGMVRVVDLESGSQVSAVQPAQNAGVFGALSPKGETLATWGQHYNRGNGKPEDEQKIARTIQLWDAKEGKEKAALVSDIYQIASVRFSPDGAKVAAGGNGVVQ